MKHTPPALARLLLSVSVVLILVASVLPQHGLLSSWVDARDSESDIETQNDESSTTYGPTAPESENIESVSTTSNTATDSTSADDGFNLNDGPTQPDSDNIELVLTNSPSDESSSTGSPTPSGSDEIEPVSSIWDKAAESPSGAISSTLNSSSNSGSSSSGGSSVPLQTASSDTADSSSF